jgi:copper resistance protein C
MLAHAILLKSTPSANAVLHDGEVTFALQFNSRVDGKRSQITLVSTGGQRKIALEPQTEADRLHSEKTAVAPGTYRLIWQVLAADGHLTRGQIPFSVQ